MSSLTAPAEETIDPAPASPRNGQREATARLLEPVKAQLRRAGIVTVAAGLVWPLQAAAIAIAISSWTAGKVDLSLTILCAGAFLLGGLVKAALEHHAGRILFTAADQVVARERQRLTSCAAKGGLGLGSAEIAALAVQKLPLLQPFVTRYQMAMMRVAVIPLTLVLISLWFSWVVAAILLVAGPLIPLFMALVGMAAEQASRRQMVEIGSINAALMERLSALLDIRLLGAGERALADFEARADDLRERTMAVLKIAFLSSTVLELFAAIGVAMVAVYVGFNLLGELTFGSWVPTLNLGAGLFLLLLAPEFFQPLRDLAAAWHDRASGLAVVAELDALESGDQPARLGAGRALPRLEGPLALALSGCAVARGIGSRLALPDLVLKPGEAVALVGPSGSGKSTTLAVIAGLVPTSAGAVRVCGEPLGDINADAWRARLAVIPQRPHFADETLAAFLDPRATGADPWPALQLAQARRLVERLPNGLATRLGETGDGVSGGEARRLLIARAVMAGGDLVLADEPTADLDPETAAFVTNSLLALKERGLTLIVATHDLALAAALDRTVEMPR
ncbi:ATP-binding cassette domain-containing protein [Jiella sp. MQZ9-1]|uniref:ATP-binding cassette domain-containing protein n=1 Tax=Jiella flava TaxID=2816857 RepID=A0A939JU99_9HYPH|nr:ATP-binding cassette domain-containing protein [Jiella flava]MBO0661204.1 ATP-binding cassette domain-containing protein [Jiella flava]MCD2469849.1 ATP-binding cassette domain-containing protein [Jiella flava]